MTASLQERRSTTELRRRLATVGFDPTTSWLRSPVGEAMSQARFLCATSLLEWKELHLSGFGEEEKMSDHDYTSEEESVNWVEEELRDMKSQLVHERSFRKVYTAVGILAFLYGLFYGVYLSK